MNRVFPKYDFPQGRVVSHGNASLDPDPNSRILRSTYTGQARGSKYIPDDPDPPD